MTNLQKGDDEAEMLWLSLFLLSVEGVVVIKLTSFSEYIILHDEPLLSYLIYIIVLRTPIDLYGEKKDEHIVSGKNV